ncbi:MAG: hypothetical protein ACLS8R_02495 [Anaeromassilibacillus sp.]
MERKANSSPFAFVGNAVGASRPEVCRRRVPTGGLPEACPDRRSAVGAEGTVCPLCAY